MLRLDKISEEKLLKSSRIVIPSRSLIGRVPSKISSSKSPVYLSSEAPNTPASTLATNNACKLSEHSCQMTRLGLIGISKGQTAVCLRSRRSVHQSRTPSPSLLYVCSAWLRRKSSVRMSSVCLPPTTLLTWI